MHAVVIMNEVIQKNHNRKAQPFRGKKRRNDEKQTNDATQILRKQAYLNI